MSLLKTYSKANDVDGPDVNHIRLDEELKECAHINNYQGVGTKGDEIRVYGDSFISEANCDTLVKDHIADETIEQITVAYDLRNKGREKTLLQATMSFVGYFMALGDDKPTAEDKVSQMSNEVSSKLYLYILGNRQPLLDAINASTLTHMNQAAKDYLIGALTP